MFAFYELQGNTNAYNARVSTYNATLADVKNNLKELKNRYNKDWTKKWYDSFINLVEVNLLLPEQDKLEINSKEEEK